MARLSAVTADHCCSCASAARVVWIPGFSGAPDSSAGAMSAARPASSESRYSSVHPVRKHDDVAGTHLDALVTDAGEHLVVGDGVVHGQRLGVARGQHPGDVEQHPAPGDAPLRDLVDPVADRVSVFVHRVEPGAVVEDPVDTLLRTPAVDERVPLRGSLRREDDLVVVHHEIAIAHVVEVSCLLELRTTERTIRRQVARQVQGVRHPFHDGGGTPTHRIGCQVVQGAELVVVAEHAPIREFRRLRSWREQLHRFLISSRGRVCGRRS